MQDKIVLIVEDELPLQDAIRMKLENSGFKAVTARSVEQAINLLEDLERVDVIWLDHYLLGKENGLDFVAKLKDSEKWNEIPIFIVSNTATEEKVKAYLQLGVDKYYLKSNYRLDQIIDDIKVHFKK